jgi:hypothetical protein
MAYSRTSNLSRRHFLKTAGKLIAGTAALSLYGNLEAQKEEPKYKPEELWKGHEKGFGILYLMEGYTKDMKKQAEADSKKIYERIEFHEVLKELKPLLRLQRLIFESTKKIETADKADGTGTILGYKYNKNGYPELSQEGNELCTSLREKFNCLPCVIVPDEYACGLSSILLVKASIDLDLFYHELGLGLGLNDEKPIPWGRQRVNNRNVTFDDKNPPWKSLEDNKYPGIKTAQIEGDPKAYRGEVGHCIMCEVTEENAKYGPIDATFIWTYIRSKTGIIDTATDNSKVIEHKKGDKTPLEIKVLNTASAVQAVNAWQASGSADEMNKKSEELKRTKQTIENFTDKKVYTPVPITYDKKDKTKALVDLSKLAPGSYTIAVIARDKTKFEDPKSLIILDPDKNTIENRIYRVEIKG